jgi:predicted GH43/DUF377 family glycosyl hydrolase
MKYAHFWSIGALAISACSSSPNTPIDAAVGVDSKTIDAPTVDARLPDVSKLKASCFALESTNPVLERGEQFAGSTWGDPHVIKVGAQYIMYATSDHDFDGNIGVYRLTSPDGVAWTLAPTMPVFVKSPVQTDWDRKSAETPSVVFFKGKYYMFYTGYPNAHDAPKEYRVMMATSADGITWQRQPHAIAPTDPTNDTPSLDFRQWIVAEPGAMVFKDDLYVYFTAMGADLSVSNTLFTIGVTRSSDGLLWTEPQVAFKPDQAVYPRASNWQGYSTPMGLEINGQAHLFFDVATETPFQQTKIHHAVSPNGVDQWQQDSEALLDRSQLAPWADENVVSPTVVLDGTQLKMWVSGTGTTANFPNVKMGVGLARCEL